MVVPKPLRDAVYQIVAENRYRWFGTQALDKNFAKSLCPYFYFKQKQAERAGGVPVPTEGSSALQGGGVAGAKHE